MSPQETIARLRAALFGLIGAETPEELQHMDAELRAMSVPDADKAVMLAAIQALLDTDPAKESERRRAILERENELYRAMENDPE
jgi:hypothetical protein